MIHSAIARGENTRSKIEAVVKRELGGYMTKLEHDYGLVAKSTPIFSKVETKNVCYVLDDNFLMFWFRFIYKYGTKFIQSGNITNIGGYWDRKGENDIDLVVVNELDRQAQIVEVKRKAESLDLDTLRDKGVHLNTIWYKTHHPVLRLV